MDTMNIDRKKIIFDIPLELHTQIKVHAAMKRMSMSLWIHRALLDRIKKESKEQQ